MAFLRQEERGQTMVEFALICTILLTMTVGLVDVGRAFYQYNALAAAARYGARWGAVIGGTCQDENGAVLSSNDWCDQLQQSTSGFWQQTGNKPLQGNASCPNGISGGFTGYYTVSNYLSSTATTIVGAIAQRFDSNSSGPNTVAGGLTPGIDLSQMKVCIEMPYTSGGNMDTRPGSIVKVHVYYPFYPVSTLVTSASLVLTASAQYVIE